MRQYATARPARTSPLHARLQARGACFGETAGWERPHWFAPDGSEPRYDYGYGRTSWFEHWAAEHRGVRGGCGLIDLSSFGKFLLQGRDAEAVLQKVCSNELAIEPGGVVYTLWLNEQGGIEADLTVTRLADDAFMIMTTAARQTRDFAWLRRHLPDDAHAWLTDMTSAYAVIGLMGPASRSLLARLTPADVSSSAFPISTFKEIEIGYAPVLAQRISYVGELGFELYVPSEFALPLFDVIMGEAGGELTLTGLHAVDSLRLERGFRHIGHDITSEDTPIEAGLSFACAFEKPVSFIGRDALLPRREAPRIKRLVQFKLIDPAPLLFHDEPIIMDGERIGLLTSGSYGHTLGAAVGMGYLQHPDGVTGDLLDAARFEIEVAGERFKAEASLRPLFDPQGARMRA
jgi:heterotetrameric sarcosine oxidase gamma subunit